MANKWFTKLKQKFGTNAAFDLSSAGVNVKALLIDMAQLTNQITAVTNATPAQITSATHGLTTGDKVIIAGIVGSTGANGYWTVTVVDANNFTIDNGSNPGAYTSGGSILRLSVDEFLSAIPAGARAATSANLTTKTFNSLGVWDADDTTFGTVATGPICRGVILYRDTGVAGTSNLIVWIDNATNLPVTPNGGTVNLQFSASGIHAL
jgi:hypothetical protein